MSGGHSAIRWLQVGAQTGTTDTPGAFTFIDVQGDLSVTAEQTKLAMGLENDDGEKTAGALGPKTGGLSFQTLLRGKGTGAADDPADAGECATMLSSLCGAVATGTGEASDSDNSVTVITMSDTSGMAIGNAVMMINGSTLYEARTITALSTNTSITVYPALSNEPANSADVYASQTYASNAADTDHAHLYFKAEGENWRRDFLGCGVKCGLTLPVGGLAALNWDVTSNDWEDTAEENPTYSAPTAHGGIAVLGSPLYLGSTKTELIDASFDFGWAHAPRVATEGANGANGFVYTNEGGKFTGRVYHNDTTMAAFQSTTAQSLFLQIGDVASAAAVYNSACLYLPALDVETAKIGSFNGVDTIDFSGTCTRPSSGAAGGWRFSIFGSAT